jgi:hypothetical protein
MYRVKKLLGKTRNSGCLMPRGRSTILGGGAKWKVAFFKCNISAYKDVPTGRIKALIAFMRGAMPQEYATRIFEIQL